MHGRRFLRVDRWVVHDQWRLLSRLYVHPSPRIDVGQLWDPNHRRHWWRDGGRRNHLDFGRVEFGCRWLKFGRWWLKFGRWWLKFGRWWNNLDDDGSLRFLWTTLLGRVRLLQWGSL
jgi:hypothetical protein